MPPSSFDLVASAAEDDDGDDAAAAHTCQCL